MLSLSLDHNAPKASSYWSLSGLDTSVSSQIQPHRLINDDITRAFWLMFLMLNDRSEIMSRIKRRSRAVLQVSVIFWVGTAVENSTNTVQNGKTRNLENLLLLVKPAILFYHGTMHFLWRRFLLWSLFSSITFGLWILQMLQIVWEAFVVNLWIPGKAIDPLSCKLSNPKFPTSNVLCFFCSRCLLRHRFTSCWHCSFQTEPSQGKFSHGCRQEPWFCR